MCPYLNQLDYKLKHGACKCFTGDLGNWDYSITVHMFGLSSISPLC